MKIIEVAKIAKKVTKKAFTPAYITPSGSLVACNADMSVLFTAEIDAAIADTGKTYDASALDYIGKSGTIAGGVLVDPANTGAYEIPEDNYKFVTRIDIKNLKYIAEYASRDESRPVLTGFHIGGGYIEACDGFRATRYKVNIPEEVNIIVPAVVLSYGGLKKAVTIETGAKYARITSDTGAVFYTRLLAGNYINMSAIMDGRKVKNTITIKPENIAPMIDFINSMRGLKEKDCSCRRAPLLLHLDGSKLELGFISASVNGYKAFAVDNNNFDNELAIAVNPEYIYTALKGGANQIEFGGNNSPIVFTDNTAAGFESLILPIRFSEYKVKEYIDDVKAELAATDTTPAKIEDTPETTPPPAVEDPANIEDNTPATDNTNDVNQDTAPAIVEDPTPDNRRPISEEIYQAVYNTATLIFTLKRRNYEPTPAALAFAESYAREHRDIINEMQRARGHVYQSGIELIAAVYTIQNRGVAA